MNNSVLLTTGIILFLGLIYIIYVIYFDSKEIDEPIHPPKRSRNNKGRFIGDDPLTPDVNEAWENGISPKSNKGRPKGSKNKPKTFSKKKKLKNNE
jgi:hypothetical protein